MCGLHYIEALEHSAHITTVFSAARDLVADALNRVRLERLAERVAQNVREKKALGEQSGRLFRESPGR